MIPLCSSQNSLNTASRVAFWTARQILVGKSQRGCRMDGQGGSCALAEYIKAQISRVTAMLPDYLKCNTQKTPNRHYWLASILSTQTHIEARGNFFFLQLHNFSHAFPYPYFNITHQEKVYIATVIWKKKKILLICFSAWETLPKFIPQTWKYENSGHFQWTQLYRPLKSLSKISHYLHRPLNRISVPKAEIEGVLK